MFKVWERYASTIEGFRMCYKRQRAPLVRRLPPETILMEYNSSDTASTPFNTGLFVGGTLSYL